MKKLTSNEMTNIHGGASAVEYGLLAQLLATGKKQGQVMKVVASDILAGEPKKGAVISQVAHLLIGIRKSM
jgi:hypothetical protein